jgi:hypothetical protein
MSKDTKSKSRKKNVTFAAIRQQYAKRKGIDVTKASKQLRAKIRGQYGKNDTVTRYVDRCKSGNADGNRYGDATAAEAKVLINL